MHVFFVPFFVIIRAGFNLAFYKYMTSFVDILLSELRY